jgi:hypothetical protein
VPAVPDRDDGVLGDEHQNRAGLDDVTALVALVALHVREGPQREEEHAASNSCGGCRTPPE